MGLFRFSYQETETEPLPLPESGLVSWLPLTNSMREKRCVSRGLCVPAHAPNTAQALWRTAQANVFDAERPSLPQQTAGQPLDR